MNNKIDYDNKVLEVRDLKQQFRISRKKGGKIYAIDGISFDVYKREVFGLVGESGCGKTTTGRTIIKLYQPTDGVVKFNDYPISQGYYENTKIIRRARVATKVKIREANPLKKLIFDEKSQYDHQKALLHKELKAAKKKYKASLIEANKDYIEYQTQLIQLKNRKDNDVASSKFLIEKQIREIKKNVLKEINYETRSNIVFSKKRLKKKISSIKISPISKEEKMAQSNMAREQFKNEISDALENKKQLFKEHEGKLLTKEQKQKEIQKLTKELEQSLEKITKNYEQELKELKKEQFAEPISKEEKANLKTIYLNEVNQVKVKEQELLKKHKENLRQINEQAKQNPEAYKIDQEAILEAKKAFKEVVVEQKGIIKEAKRVSSLSEKPEITLERKVQIDELKKEAAKEIETLKQNDPNLSDETKAKIKEIKKVLKEKINEVKATKVTYKKVMKSMQMIFQDPISSLDPRMTVHDIIAEGLVIQGVKDKEFIDKKVKESLELVGLTESHSSRYIHEFSGGQRQRIGIARALVVEPEFIIADEPISALDVSIQAQVINLLTDLKEKLGLTILFIAHDLSVVKYFSDRIAVMHRGKIVELASSEELFTNPLHPYTKSLLSAIPHPDPISEKQRTRVEYNPNVHNYSTDKPEMVEIKEGHFIYANNEELALYQQELKDKGVL